MIDATEGMLSSAPKTTRRRSGSGSVSANRNAKSRNATPTNPLGLERVFSSSTVKPFDQIEWELRTAEITDDAGKIIFKQENVEVPKFWSLLATKVVVSKYFYGEQGTSERETSVRQLISRICRTIT